MADGTGPQRSMLALGYAGWAPGQLDAEIQANGWLNVSSDPELIFGGNLDGKWNSALDKLGIDLGALSGVSGRA
jgi:putative transcriptional regulator